MAERETFPIMDPFHLSERGLHAAAGDHHDDDGVAEQPAGAAVPAAPTERPVALRARQTAGIEFTGAAPIWCEEPL